MQSKCVCDIASVIAIVIVVLSPCMCGFTKFLRLYCIPIVFSLAIISYTCLLSTFVHYCADIIHKIVFCLLKIVFIYP